MFGPSVFLAMPSATALVAPSGIVIDVNAEWRRLTGDDATDDAGAPLWRRFAPAERSHITTLVERAHDTVDVPEARPLVAGTQLRQADGHSLDVALRVGATRDSGAPVLIVQMEQLAEPRHDTRTRPGTGDRHLALATITRSVATGTDVQRIGANVVAAVARATGCPLVGLWRRASRHQDLVLVEGVGFGSGTRGSLVLDGHSDGLADHTIRSRGAVVIGGPTGTVARIPRVLAERGVSSGVAVPLHGVTGDDGLLTISATHNQPIGDEDIRFLGIVGDLLTMLLQRESVDLLIAGERQRTAMVAHDLESMRRRHRIAVAAAELRDWCWVSPEQVATRQRMDPPPRWSVQVCLDGGPQALVDCAVADDVEPTVEALNAAFAQGDDLDLKVRLRCSEGLVAVRVRGVVERDHSGAVRQVWGLAAVTPPAEVPAQVTDDTADQRLAHTAHDLNNLLAAVLGTAQHLIEQGGDRRRLGAIVRAGRRARELVSGLRPGNDAAHPLAGAYDVSDVVEQLRPLLHGLVGPDVRLVFQLRRGVRTSHPSRVRLEHALLDLVANSRDALTDGGTVVIATDTCVQLEDAAGPQAPPIGSWARVRVCDNGVGMTAQERDRVFAPGYSTKAGHDHAGLGLSAVRDTVNAAGGTIGIDSAPGHGTVIDLYLPLATQQATRLQPLPLRPPQRTDGAAPAPDAGARVALIVDDEPALRHLLPELLGRLGYDAVVAGDGASALEVARDLDRLDLVVSDLLMPQMNGLELARRVRGIHGHAAVVLLSGAPPTTPIADRNLRVLRKPFEWNDLRDAVLSLTPRDSGPPAALEASLPAVSGR
jgi:signal transduction histidine kinase/CheY-like chemotaxis protein